MAKKNYDPNVDYMEKIKEAAAAGDFEAAAVYEQQRNEKIQGEGLGQYAQTHTYEKYLPKTTRQKMDQVLKKLESREPFTFDLEGDKVYHYYKGLYAKEGKLAMEDSMGRAAALTGGYGNSYGDSLGQQAYEKYMSKTGELAAQRYEEAKSDYDAQGKALEEEYSRLAKEEEKEQEAARKAEELAYERALKAQEKEEKAQQAERDRAYDLAMKLLKEGQMPSDKLLSGSGLDREDAEKLYYAYGGGTAGGASSNGGSATHSGGGSSGSSSGSGSSKGNSSAGKGENATGSGSNGGTSSSGGVNGVGWQEYEAGDGKALSASQWTKLDETYRQGAKEQDLTEFYRMKSMLAAQGYDVGSFDAWGKGVYGSSYGYGNGPIVDRDSVLAMGYGPLSDAKLEALVKAGEVISYIRGSRIYYQRVKNPPNQGPY